MNRSRRSIAEVIDLLSELEIALSNGQNTDDICRRANISEQSYRHWRDWSAQSGTDKPHERLK
jgi:hypothetical protein